MKKLLALLLVVAMVMGLACVASADDVKTSTRFEKMSKDPAATNSSLRKDTCDFAARTSPASVSFSAAWRRASKTHRASADFFRFRRALS